MAKKKDIDVELTSEVSFLQSELATALKNVEKLRLENLQLTAENSRLSTLLKRQEESFEKLRNSLV